MSTAFSYTDLKLEQVNQLKNVQFYGIPIQLGQNSYSSKMRGCIPIEFGCLCVHDSPDSPCPCRKLPPIIVWLPEDRIFKQSPADKKNHDGRELTLFEVENTAQIFLEKLLPFNISTLRAALSPGRKTGGDNGQPGSLQKKRSKVAKAVIAAFSFGWEIGEAIDEETGASDELADWLYDTFGPWPF